MNSNPSFKTALGLLLVSLPSCLELNKNAGLITPYVNPSSPVAASTACLSYSTTSCQLFSSAQDCLAAQGSACDVKVLMAGNGTNYVCYSHTLVPNGCSTGSTTSGSTTLPTLPTNPGGTATSSSPLITSANRPTLELDAPLTHLGGHYLNELPYHRVIALTNHPNPTTGASCNTVIDSILMPTNSDFTLDATGCLGMTLLPQGSAPSGSPSVATSCGINAGTTNALSGTRSTGLSVQWHCAGSSDFYTDSHNLSTVVYANPLTLTDGGGIHTNSVNFFTQCNDLNYSSTAHTWVKLTAGAPGTVIDSVAVQPSNATQTGQINYRGIHNNTSWTSASSNFTPLASQYLLNSGANVTLWFQFFVSSPSTYQASVDFNVVVTHHPANRPVNSSVTTQNTVSRTAKCD